MPAEIALLRHKARRCRELAIGQARELASGLRRLADEYDAEAAALENRDDAAGPQPTAAGHGHRS